MIQKWLATPANLGLCRGIYVSGMYIPPIHVAVCVGLQVLETIRDLSLFFLFMAVVFVGFALALTIIQVRCVHMHVYSSSSA